MTNETKAIAESVLEQSITEGTVYRDLAQAYLPLLKKAEALEKSAEVLQQIEKERNAEIQSLKEHLRMAGEEGSYRASGDWFIDDSWFEKTDSLLADTQPLIGDKK